MDAINKGFARSTGEIHGLALIPTICSALALQTVDTSSGSAGGAMADHAHPAAAECRGEATAAYRVPGFSAPGFTAPAPGQRARLYRLHPTRVHLLAAGVMERRRRASDASQTPGGPTLSYGCAFLNTLIWRRGRPAGGFRLHAGQKTSDIATITRRPGRFCRPIGPDHLAPGAGEAAGPVAQTDRARRAAFRQPPGAGGI